MLPLPRGLGASLPGWMMVQAAPPSSAQAHNAFATLEAGRDRQVLQDHLAHQELLGDRASQDTMAYRDCLGQRETRDHWLLRASMCSGERVKMTKIVLEHLAFLGSLAYVAKEGNRGPQVFLEHLVHLDYLVSRVNVDHLGSMAPKENRVLQDCPDTLVPWVPLGYLVQEENEDYQAVQEKRAIRDFKASLVFQGHLDLQGSQEKQDYLDLLGLPQKRAHLAWMDWMGRMGNQDYEASKGRQAIQAFRGKRVIVANQGPRGVLAGLGLRGSQVQWGLRVDQVLLAMLVLLEALGNRARLDSLELVSQAQMGKQAKRVHLENQAPPDQLDRRVNLDLQGREDTLERKAGLECLGGLEKVAPWAPLDHVALPGREDSLANLVLQETPVTLDCLGQ
ncbi:UNVERIFIED_CONTAM: hypothetical protein K2H54_046902, partial [Gekko kuhli]